jgi:hypothetical protein
LVGEMLFKFQEKATTNSISPKFSTSWICTGAGMDSKDFFTKNNKLMNALNDVKNHLHSFCMQSPFRIIPTNSDGSIIHHEAPTNMLDFNTAFTEDAIRRSNVVYADWTDDKLHPENLAWSQALLLNSVDADLRKDISDRLLSIPSSEQGGPLILYMIMNHLGQITVEGSRDIINRLQALKVTDFDGENILNFLATFNAGVVRLERVSATPPDLCNILRHGLRTSTVDYFNQFINTIEMTRDPRSFSYVHLKLAAVEQYESLSLQGRWLATTKKGTNPHFTATDLRNHKREPLGNGSSQTQTTNGQTTNGRPPVDRTPPGPGKPDQRKNTSGRVEYWCGHEACSRWGNHLTSEHDPDWRNKRNAERKATQAAKSAAKAASPTDGKKQDADTDKTTQANTKANASVHFDQDEVKPSLLSRSRRTDFH